MSQEPVAAVIGHPIGHSLSPAIHRAALRADGRPDDYRALDVPPAELAATLDRLASGGCRGVSVTIPHKQAVCELAGWRSPEVDRVGAANLLVFDGGSVRAHNTDVAAIASAVAELAGSAATAVVLGAGGAGRAAVAALVDRGVEGVQVANRTPAAAGALASAAGPGVTTVEWGRRGGACADADLIVNATSVGLDGASSPLDEDDLDATRAAVLDLVYAAEPTPLVAGARVRGLPAEDGLRVLVLQAEAAYRLLWGAEPPAGVMGAAALEAAGRST